MRTAIVLVNNVAAGELKEVAGGRYQFHYLPDYQSAPVSLAMPVNNSVYHFEQFPPFFEGLLPEGVMLEALLRKYKLDKKDYFGQLMQVGNDVIGAVTVKEVL